MFKVSESILTHAHTVMFLVQRSMMWMISPGIPKYPGRPRGTVESAIRNNSFNQQKQEVNSSPFICRKKAGTQS